MEAELAILAVLVAAYALVAARLDRFSVGPALVFVAIGADGGGQDPDEPV